MLCFYFNKINYISLNLFDAIFLILITEIYIIACCCPAVACSYISKCLSLILINYHFISELCQYFYLALISLLAFDIYLLEIFTIAQLKDACMYRKYLYPPL